MTDHSAFEDAFARCPLVAILRGVRPDEVIDVAEALIVEGFALIEVPLNSPEPFVSISRLAAHVGDRAVIGAGTVLAPADVGRVSDAGGRMIISPNADPAVIAASLANEMVSLPGIATPSEAFAALAAGAHALKLFPAEAANPAVLKAMRAVLPPGTRFLPVGGITPEGMALWRAAGAAGFGLGSALYAAGRSAGEVRAQARAFVTALDR